MSDASKPMIGISACLAGEAVRYDAGHKRQSLLIELLTPRAQLKPFCPEVEAGLGVPRPPVQLIEISGGRVQARGLENESLDVTDALAATASDYCRQQLNSLSGFIFKSRSPSCGLGSTPLSTAEGKLLGYSDGIFADQVRKAAPWLPCVEESWLANQAHCHRFLGACCAVAYYRHGNRHYTDLVAVLEPELQLGANTSAMDSIVRSLLTPAEDEQKVAAKLTARLLHYFRSGNPAP